MKENFSISIYLDTRRKLQNGKYPVKLRVFTPYPRIQKLYKLITIKRPKGFEMTNDEFSKIWETTKPRTEHKETRFELQTLEIRALDVAKNLTPFSIEAFEREMFGAKFDTTNVVAYYQRKIESLKEAGQFSTASTYNLAIKSIVNFIEQEKGKPTNKILFASITPLVLNKYERFMINIEGKSRTTVSMYVRTLRTIFNDAIKDKKVDFAFYPFGKGKYSPPSAKTVKKALNDLQLKTLFEGKPLNPEQAKAKDFWFFSYSCNGMNLKDILNIKFEDIQGETFSFYRAKTINTKTEELTPVTVFLNDFTKGVIEKYGNTNTSPENYVFTIIDRTQDPERQYRQVKIFTRYINQHFKNDAESLGIKEDISLQWARHSFATRAIRNKASMEFVSEALGHSNLQTTKGYFAGFASDQKKEFAATLMDF
ncbi:MAG: site-specific integrase [Bacteroidia bacterium]|nr:site-specific integrase [Bacteroidia bacterium]